MSAYMNQTNGVLYDAGSRIYNAAIYARLSDDDADKGETKESDSIVNQKEYIRADRPELTRVEQGHPLLQLFKLCEGLSRYVPDKALYPC